MLFTHLDSILTRMQRGGHVDVKFGKNAVSLSGDKSEFIAPEEVDITTHVAACPPSRFSKVLKFGSGFFEGFKSTLIVIRSN